ncbi:DUF2452 domain-containing protein [Marinoscillum luteum]|uniref:DUF2452 domain-containing protein n=1 Tax=Marinoscillum luteum TaxID=861051 RepID=A0ABW7N2P3_9BACT
MQANKIDVSKIDMEKEREKITDFPGLIAFAHTVGSALIKPEDKGKIKGQALAAMHDQTDRQFRQVMDQMRVLMEQAHELKMRVKVSERIYQSTLNFTPVIHQVYHLYRRKDGSDFLSMIAPAEWGRKLPFEKHEASVRLLSDHTWEVLEDHLEDES